MSVTELTLPKLSSPLRIWEKIEIIVGEDDTTGIYSARIEDFINEGILINNPEFVSGKSLLRNNLEVRLIVTRKDAVYQCYSRISRLSRGGRQDFLLSPPRQVSRVQRRQFVRIDMLESVTWGLVGPIMDYDHYDEAIKWQDSKCVNLSGGGIMLRVDDSVRVEDRLLLKIELFPSQGLPDMIGAVCRRRTMQKDIPLAGLEFVTKGMYPKVFSKREREQLPESIGDFDKSAQNRLATYTFQKQIELRQKGLI